MGENNNDKELVKRAQKGDKVAFDALVIKYQYKVVNLVTRYVKNEHDAQEGLLLWGLTRMFGICSRWAPAR